LAGEVKDAGLGAGVRKEPRSDAAAGFVLEVSLEAPAGITILFGPSGAGKSTLLDCIAGLVRPDTGRIAIGEQVLLDSNRGVNLPPPQRHIAYMFPTLALFPPMTVETNVAFGVD